jgi:hypothetical protein
VVVQLGGQLLLGGGSDPPSGDPVPPLLLPLPPLEEAPESGEVEGPPSREPFPPLLLPVPPSSPDIPQFGFESPLEQPDATASVAASAKRGAVVEFMTAPPGEE